jgi:hypothetical protein
MGGLDTVYRARLPSRYYDGRLSGLRCDADSKIGSRVMSLTGSRRFGFGLSSFFLMSRLHSERPESRMTNRGYCEEVAYWAEDSLEPEVINLMVEKPCGGKLPRGGSAVLRLLPHSGTCPWLPMMVETGNQINTPQRRL